MKENFDELLFKPDHPGRSRTDTFYFDQNNLLRTHTSAHQNKVRRSTSFYIQVLRDLTRLWSIRSEIYLYSSLLSPSLLILSPFRCETVSPWWKPLLPGDWWLLQTWWNRCFTLSRLPSSKIYRHLVVSSNIFSTFDEELSIFILPLMCLLPFPSLFMWHLASLYTILVIITFHHHHYSQMEGVRIYPCKPDWMLLL